MPMNDEKLLILKMLEEGKINSEEAAKLLEALDGTAGQASSQVPPKQKQQNFQDEINKMRERLHEWKKDFKNNYNQKDFDQVVEELSSKAEKLGRNVASTTFGIVDKVVDFVGSIVDTNVFNFFGNYPVVEKTFEAIAAEGVNLDIEGVNSYIVVKKHLDSKIVIKSKIKSPANLADSLLVFNDTGNSISLKVNKTSNISVAHEVFLPAIRLGELKFETSNGRIYVEDSISQGFTGITRNGHIELMGINSDKVYVSTKNAKIQVSYVIGKDIDINTNNSVIDVKHVKTGNLKASTANGRILVENIQNLDSPSEMFMHLKTSNGGIKVNMNDMDNRGYKVKGQTTNGGINLLIPEITYHNINKQGTGGSFVEAESSGYNNYTDKVSIHAETINGYIEIVK